MRDWLKPAFFYFFKLIGVYTFFRRRQNHAVVVLTYHGVVRKIPENLHRFEYRNFVTVGQFEKQIRFMLRHYKPVTVGQLVSGDPAAFQRGFIITFDDGFRNNLELAAPVLQKYGLEGCFFISTGLVGENEMIWPERITYLLFATSKTSIEITLDRPTTVSLRTPGEREKASWQIRNYLKGSTKERINSVLEELEMQAGDLEELDAEQKRERYAFMNWDEVKALYGYGQIVGSHTHNHEVLSTLNAGQVEEELKKSRQLLETHTGQTICFFSYPNGAEGDFEESHKNLLKQTGYTCAFSQIHGNNYADTDCYELRRINISQGMSPIVFEAAVCGFLERIKSDG